MLKLIILFLFSSFLLIICFLGVNILFSPPQLKLTKNNCLYLAQISNNILKSHKNEELKIYSILSEGENFPDGLINLGIKSILLLEDGIYFKCWNFFLASAGYFYPKNFDEFNRKIQDNGARMGDTIYEYIDSNIFYYYSND